MMDSRPSNSPISPTREKIPIICKRQVCYPWFHTEHAILGV